MSRVQAGPAPCTVVILGAAGDLTRRKLLPAIYNLALDGLLPERYAVMGFARRDLDDESFRTVAREGVKSYSRRPVDEDRWPEFESNVFYTRGSFDDAGAFLELKRRLEEVEAERGIPANRVFYLSIPPSAIETCVQQLKAAGLAKAPDGSYARVIVEKPVGHDLASAREINDTVAAVFDEEDVFRIDHYLGKETVQSILVLRFSNSIFEPLWNQKYIDHVQITVSEEEGVGTRGGYYEEAGALRDMVQNHILQLLCLTAMEPPWSLDAEVVRDHKMGVLNCLRPLRGAEVNQHVIRAQYGPGTSGGEDVRGYRREDRVAPESTTETYVAIQAYVDNWRWSGVPFYIRTGKQLPKRASEIAIQFKCAPPVLFNANPEQAVDGNVLVLRIQPDEGLTLQIATKQPGPNAIISPVDMDFNYGTAFAGQSPEAYERLLLDVAVGDASLFMRRDAVEASWEWVTGILEGWEASGSRWLPEYAAGSWGPVEADRMIEAAGRRWRTL
ncbi:MAG: glucose-6-phosphate dehydrogenase [Candidatus Binatia bacterium]|nr:glucose-6-phosphate dehydrogenase [Candidatus Binatia bacterium]